MQLRRRLPAVHVLSMFADAQVAPLIVYRQRNNRRSPAHPLSHIFLFLTTSNNFKRTLSYVRVVVSAFGCC